MKLRILVLSVFLFCSGATLAFDQEETFTDLTQGKDMLDPARIRNFMLMPFNRSTRIAADETAGRYNRSPASSRDASANVNWEALTTSVVRALREAASRSRSTVRRGTPSSTSTSRVFIVAAVDRAVRLWSLDYFASFSPRVSLSLCSCLRSLSLCSWL